MVDEKNNSFNYITYFQLDRLGQRYQGQCYHVAVVDSAWRCKDANHILGPVSLHLKSGKETSVEKVIKTQGESTRFYHMERW